MNAKEMFEELGYKLSPYVNYEGSRCLLSYILNDDDELSIDFMKDKTIQMWIYELTPNLVKAINQQCKELGWIDE